MDLTGEMRKTIRIGAEEGVAANCHLTISLLDDIDELRNYLRGAHSYVYQVGVRDPKDQHSVPREFAKEIKAKLDD